jgi:hypothetical protein
MTEVYWDLESNCQLKHLLKAEGNCKETVDKAVRDGGIFDPEGGELRNFLTAVENLECAVGHYEEFSSLKVSKAWEETRKGNGEKADELLEEASYYMNMNDSTRYVRQRLTNCPGRGKRELLTCLNLISELIDKQVEFMRGKDVDGLLEVDELEEE